LIKQQQQIEMLVEEIKVEERAIPRSASYGESRENNAGRSGFASIEQNEHLRNLQMMGMNLEQGSIPSVMNESRLSDSLSNMNDSMRSLPAVLHSPRQGQSNDSQNELPPMLSNSLAMLFRENPDEEEYEPESSNGVAANSI